MGDSHNSSSQRICRYDVFLNFRGTDTRNTFTDHLYNNLIRNGIRAFKDDQTLQKGESISLQLLQAIKDSRVSIVVFSKDYAASTWCLDEMAAIAECLKELKQTVFPVFYDVDPSDVRKQSGDFEKAFISHTEKFKREPGMVNRWKSAMRDLGGLAGWHMRDDKSEFEEIEKIIQAVIKALGHKFSGATNNDLIGIQPRVDELEKILKLGSEDDDFRVLGIWGMGGIGKTTHATVLYDRISYQFAARCFIDNVSKIYRDGGAVAVQKQILHQALGAQNLKACDASDISRNIRLRLHSSIKVLLVLDNVDKIEQLLELAINPKSLCRGSRIIITTRDVHILKVYRADKVHEVQLLNSDDAHELFCRKAFNDEDQISSFDGLIPKVLEYVQNLPLAIRVVGSSLCTRSAKEWWDDLDRLRDNPDDKVMDVLQMSVDGLNHQEKEIFLHIACFFKGERVDYVRRILDVFGLHPHIGIQRILEKSLITIRNQEIHMHEMLQDLGEKIVRHQLPEEPGSWSRLWRYEDFYHVLKKKKEAKNVKAIVLDQKENVFKCRAEGFSNVSDLRLLILYNNNFSGSLDFLSDELQYLLWHGYPFTSLPSKFEPSCLVELNMPHSNIGQLWEGDKDLPYLKRIDLSNSKNLMKTTNFFWTPKLERLDFTGCTNLSDVHRSIGHLPKLVFMSLQDCSSLVSLNFGSVSNLSSLRVLRLSGCTKLKETPDFTEASNLEYLDMDRCESLSTVHESIGALAKLRFLSLRGCTYLVGIPNSVNTMTSLVTLDLHDCLKLTTLPLKLSLEGDFHSPALKSLIFLNLSFCNLPEVPVAIGELKCLERLNLQGNNFDSLPSTIQMLESLAYLNLAHCHKLQTFPKLPSQNASSVGRYFKTESGSRDHRSGLYIFDCPKMKWSPIECLYFSNDFRQWLLRLVKEPGHFRCGFDIIVPWDWETNDSLGLIPLWFEHQFDGGSIIRIVQSNVDDNWLGFAFCVAFEVNNCPANFGSPHDSFSPPLPPLFYLSFESEHTEECFNMPLSLKLDKIDGSKHLWVIYISQEHCHFVKRGAHITFKACSGLMIKKWGMHIQTKGEKEDHFLISLAKFVTKQQQQRLMQQQRRQQQQQQQQLLEQQLRLLEQHLRLLEQQRVLQEQQLQLLEQQRVLLLVEHFVFDYVKESSSSSSSGPKIQLPYNWLVTEEEEVENFEAKSKENDLSNLGLLTH